MKKISLFILFAVLFCLNINSGCGNAPGDVNSVSPTPDGGIDITPPTIRYKELYIIDVSSTGVTLKWFSARDDITDKINLSYKIVRSLSNNIMDAEGAEKNGISVRDWANNITVQTVADLENSTTYYFNVLVKDEAGNISAYTSNSETTTFSSDAVDPVLVSGLIDISNVDYTSMTLTWTAASDNITASENLEYAVYQSETNNINTLANAELYGTRIHNWIDALTWNFDSASIDVTNLLPSKIYYFNVFVKDEAGNVTAYTMSSESTQDDSTEPTVDSGTIDISDITCTGMTLTWTAAIDDLTDPENLMYAIYMSDLYDDIDTFEHANNNVDPVLDWTKNINWNSNTASFNVSGLSPEMLYYFNVFVKDEAGNVADYTANSETTLTDSTSPVPGTGVNASVDGTVISLSWTNASDETQLSYKLVRSASPITSLPEAESATAIMDYTAFDEIVMPVSDSGLSPGTYHYNVVVRDEGDNKALYSCASETIVETAYTVSGLITLPGSNTLPSGSYFIEITDPFTFKIFYSSNSWPSGSSQTYSINNVESGHYFINAFIKNSSGNIVYSYQSKIPELIVQNGNATYQINAEQYSSNNIGIDLYDDNYDKYKDNDISTTTNGISIGDMELHTFHAVGDADCMYLNLTSGQKIVISTSYVSETAYIDTVLYFYGPDKTEIASSDNSSGLYSRISYTCTSSGTYYIKAIEKGNNGTGFYFLNVYNENEVFSVSGNLSLPGSATLPAGYYCYIQLYTSLLKDYSVLYVWTSGGNQIGYSVDDIPPDNYEIYAAIFDNNNTLQYEYDPGSDEIIHIIDSDVDLDIMLEVP